MQRKKISFFLFTMVTLAFLVLSACSGDGNSSEDASADSDDNNSDTENTEATDSSVTAEDPMTIRISSGLPATHHLVENVLVRWGEEVEERSEGRLTVEEYYGEALHSSSESLSALQNDITDITEVWPAYYPDVFDLFDVGSIPGLTPNAYVFAMVNEELYPEYTKEIYEAQGIQLAFMGPLSNKALISTEKVESIEDMKGLKVRSGDSVSTEFTKALGGTPVNLPSADIYTGLQRGTIDAAHYHTAGGHSFGLYEVAPYVMENIYTSNSPAPFAFNPKTWEELPEDLQQIVYDVNMEATMWMAESYEEGDAIAKEEGQELGWEYYNLPEEETAKFDEISEEVAQEMIDDMGGDAREYYDKFVELAEEYSDMSPEELVKYREENLIPMEEIYE